MPRRRLFFSAVACEHRSGTPGHEIHDRDGDGQAEYEVFPCDSVAGIAAWSGISPAGERLLAAGRRFADMISSWVGTAGLACRNADDWAMKCEGDDRLVLLVHKLTPKGYELPAFFDPTPRWAGKIMVIAVDTDGNGRPDIASALFQDPVYGMVFVEGAMVAGCRQTEQLRK